MDSTIPDIVDQHREWMSVAFPELTAFTFRSGWTVGEIRRSYGLQETSCWHLSTALRAFIRSWSPARHSLNLVE